jgi:hypothetical protein
VGERGLKTRPWPPPTATITTGTAAGEHGQLGREHGEREAAREQRGSGRDCGRVVAGLRLTATVPVVEGGGTEVAELAQCRNRGGRVRRGGRREMQAGIRHQSACIMVRTHCEGNHMCLILIPFWARKAQSPSVGKAPRRPDAALRRPGHQVSPDARAIVCSHVLTPRVARPLSCPATS